MSIKHSSTIKLDKNSELRRIRRTKLFFVFLVFILLVLGGIIGFLRKKEFQIKEVVITGTQSLDPELISKTTQDYLNGSYAIIIPKTNTLLLSKPALTRHILEKIPSLQKAVVTFKQKNSIEVTVTEKEPSYVWCADTCYFVDDAGIIYEESPQFSQGIFMTFSGGSVEGNPINNRFVSEQQFRSFVQMLDALDQLGIQSLEVHSAEDIAIRINKIREQPLGTTTQLLMVPHQSTQVIVDALTLLINDKVFAAALANKGRLLQYIDIRFPDKIYYKFDTSATQVTTTPPPAHAKLLEKTQ